jgi:hypothetical protein
VADLKGQEIRDAYDDLLTKGSGTAIEDGDGNAFIGAIVNNLTSTATTAPLAANQGKVLQDTKVAKSGDTMTGDLLFSGGARSIGTSDANPLRLKTNNVDAVSIGTDGLMNALFGMIIQEGSKIRSINTATGTLPNPFIVTVGFPDNRPMNFDISLSVDRGTNGAYGRYAVGGRPDESYSINEIAKTEWGSTLTTTKNNTSAVFTFSGHTAGFGRVAVTLISNIVNGDITITTNL